MRDDALGGIAGQIVGDDLAEGLRKEAGVKAVNRGEGGARLYSEATRGDGERFWMQPVQP